MQEAQKMNSTYTSATDEKDFFCLSLYIDNESFSYSFLKKDQKEICRIIHIPFGPLVQTKSIVEIVKQLLQEHKLATYSFNRIFICLGTSNFTIVPAAFSDRQSETNLLEFSNGNKVEDARTDKFRDIHFIYSPEKELLSLLEREFKNAVIKFSGSTLVELLFSNNSLKNADVLINIGEGSFELAAKRDKQLLFYNVFEFENDQDVLYYLLFMMEQYGLDSEKAKVFLAGDVKAESTLNLLLKKYIRKVSFALNAVRFAETNWKLPEHAYFTLLNQHLCGS